MSVGTAFGVRFSAFGSSPGSQPNAKRQTPNA